MAIRHQQTIILKFGVYKRTITLKSNDKISLTNFSLFFRDVK